MKSRCNTKTLPKNELATRIAFFQREQKAWKALEYGRQAIGWWAKWTTYAHYEEHIPDVQEFHKNWNLKQDR